MINGNHRQQNQKWSPESIVKRFELELAAWVSRKPTGDFTFKVDARCGGINKVLISNTFCDYNNDN